MLLAKEVLIRAVPNANPKDVIGVRYKPVPDGKGGIDFTSGNQTIDFNELGERFTAFNIRIDHAALKDLNRIRNDMEHLYTKASQQAVREAVAKGFPVVVDLFLQIGEEPHALLSDSWTAMLNVKALYDRELKQCTSTFEGVDWRSDALSEASRPCPKCSSHLVYRLDQFRSEAGFADAQCRQCGEKIDAITLIETALEAHFEYESHSSAKDGGEAPLGVFPECGTKTYICWEEESQCVNCFMQLENCERCGEALTPNNVSDDSSSLCGYCAYKLSKDD